MTSFLLTYGETVLSSPMDPSRAKGWSEWHVPIQSLANGGSPSAQRTLVGFPASIHQCACECGECESEDYASPARAPLNFVEPPPYRGITTRINPGISDADRGVTHIF